MVPKLKRTLYIGLGGTGFKTLLHTKRAFIETYGEVPPMIKFLAFDSDQNQYQTYTLPSIDGDVKFDPSESSNISVENAPDKVKRHRQQMTWLPDKNIRAIQDLVNGCGMVRTNGRVAFSFNYSRSRTAIQNALNQVHNLSTVHNEKYQLLNSDVEVNIVFSIAGGTGSGNFLDMAYLVKDILRSQGLGDSSKVIGYMVLPDVYDAQLVFGKDRLFPNGYASLLDLDYFMHADPQKSTVVDYITTQVTISDGPFNAILAIGNRNHRGDVVDNSEHLSQMMSMAMVVSAGELSGKAQGIANNLEQDMNSGVYDIDNKRAILGTLGMSEITFRAKELSKLYAEKAARELAAALLNPGSNVDNAANAWIDAEEIRENNGKDEVIDHLLDRHPKVPLAAIYTPANPWTDINNYRQLKDVMVDPRELSEKVRHLEEKIHRKFLEKVRELVNTNGPVFAIEFIAQIRGQVNIMLQEMRDELQGFQNAVMAKQSAIETAVNEFKVANGKFFGRKNAVADAQQVLCMTVRDAVVNDREIHRRNGAITFYTWFLQELDTTESKVRNIEDVVKEACKIIRHKIAATSSNLQAPRGLFEIDLTKPYLEHVEVNPSDINISQFVLTLPDNYKISNFDTLNPDAVAEYMLNYASSLSSGGAWESMSVEDALAKLPQEEATQIIQKAIALSSPMCALNFDGYISKDLINYYFVGVQEQSATKLKGQIVDLNNCIPGTQTFEAQFASIGSRDRIVIYHQYGVFPTFALAGANTYRNQHDREASRPIAYSCFIDEDIRKKMERENYSLWPKEQTDDSLELWVKGLIFGLITRDENGVFQYKDETNSERAIFDYITSLDTKYRDEAFAKFKHISNRLKPQFEEYVKNKARAEGQDALDAKLADAKLNYRDQYSLNDLTLAELCDSRNKDIASQLNREIDYVNKEL